MTLFFKCLICQEFYKPMFYKRNSKTIVVWFVCFSLSLSLSPYFLFSTHLIPKYGVIANSFTKATELLVITVHVLKFSTHWYKHVIWNTEETSRAFQAFMDKKVKTCGIFPSKFMWTESKRHKNLYLWLLSQNEYILSLAISEYCDSEIM